METWPSLFPRLASDLSGGVLRIRVNSLNKVFLLLHKRKTWLNILNGVIPPYLSNFALSLFALIPESLFDRENPLLFM